MNRLSAMQTRLFFRDMTVASTELVEIWSRGRRAELRR